MNGDHLSQFQAGELMLGPSERDDRPKTHYASDQKRRAAWLTHGAELMRRSGWWMPWGLERYGVPFGFPVH